MRFPSLNTLLRYRCSNVRSDYVLKPEKLTLCATPEPKSVTISRLWGDLHDGGYSNRCISAVFSIAFSPLWAYPLLYGLLGAE
jgi:hypothetical protein